MRITILGCGGSGGVPFATGEWGTCDHTNPLNRRRRPSILIESDGGTRILVDTGPDLREQALLAGLQRVDAILYTHAHADHVHGIDDVRAFNYHCDGAIDAWGSEATLAEIRQRFSYAFRTERPRNAWARPQLRPRPIDGAFRVGDLEVQPFRQEHGRIESTGFRIGRFAYSTDVSAFPDEALSHLEALDIWIVGAVGRNPHPSHFSIVDARAWIQRMAPARAVLTHMSISLDHSSLAHELPVGIEPGFDGMVLET